MRLCFVRRFLLSALLYLAATAASALSLLEKQRRVATLAVAEFILSSPQQAQPQHHKHNDKDARPFVRRSLNEEEDIQAETEATDNDNSTHPFFETMYSFFHHENGTLKTGHSDNSDNTPPSYPILDALISSVNGAGPGRTSLDELLLAIRCFVEGQTQLGTLPSWTEFVDRYVYKPMQEVIRNALARLYQFLDRGDKYNARIVEAVDEEVYISENYVAHIQGVTLAAYIMGPVRSEQGQNDNVGRTALAAEVLMTPNDKLSSFTDTESEQLADDYNITVVLETNVMTMRDRGVMHWQGFRNKGPNRPPGPRYCFDDLHDGATFDGVMRKGHPDSAALTGTKTFRKSLVLPMAGTTHKLSALRTVPFLSPMKSRQSVLDRMPNLNLNNESNREEPLLWSDLQPVDRAIAHVWIEESHRDPGPGIVVLREAFQRDYDGLLDVVDPVQNCIDDITNSTRFFPDISPCYDILFEILQTNNVIADLGLSEIITSGMVLYKTRSDFFVMRAELDTWQDYWLNQDTHVLRFSEVPYLFSQAMVSQEKAGGTIPMAFLANPYFTTEELYDRLSAPDFNSLYSQECLAKRKGGEDALILGDFPAALKLRLLEVPSATEWSSIIKSDPTRLERSKPLSEWGFYRHPNPDDDFMTFFFTSSNGDFLNQTVEFSMTDEDIAEAEGYQMIQRGNMTEYKAGRTGEYYVVSPFPSDEEIQTVFREQMKNTDVWARTAAEAIETDNPCRNAADDSDIYLYVIGIIAATCGGMQTVLASIHQSLHFMTGPFWERRQRRGCCSLWRFFPTYEIAMAFIGLFILIILYYPVLEQLQKEKEVQDYHTEATDLDVEFTDDFIVNFAHRGRFALVTMVHVSSSCQRSRVTLMRSILIVGIVFGVFMNAVFLLSVWKALKRYYAQIRGNNDEQDRELQNVTPQDASLRLLELPFRSRSRKNNSEESDDGLEIRENEMVSITKTPSESDEDNDQEGEKRDLDSDEEEPPSPTVPPQPEENQPASSENADSSNKTLSTQQSSSNDLESPVDEPTWMSSFFG